MQRPWSGTTPYLRGTDGRHRPYLWLRLKGPNGAEIRIVGLVDTGADKSLLPLDYAPVLGYSAETLEAVDINQVQGSASGWEAQEPCETCVVGVEAVKFEMYPMFITTHDPLWGRADLMGTFHVVVSEAAQELTLFLPA